MRGKSFQNNFSLRFNDLAYNVFSLILSGYHGMSMMDSYYSFLPKKNVTHEWKDWYDGGTFSFEWPTAWVGIDGDEEPSREFF